MHDLIPIDFPQFVGPHHARGFVRNTAWQLENSRLLICVSKYTAERVRCHASASSFRRIPLVAVASPGAFLREGVADREMSFERQNQGRKFVLYCSTIEIRKNHILLLKDGVTGWIDAGSLGADRIEIYTGPYAHAFAAETAPPPEVSLNGQAVEQQAADNRRQPGEGAERAEAAAPGFSIQ